MHSFGMARPGALVSICALGVALAFVPLARPSPVLADSSIVVTTTADSLAVDGRCSLREAVRAANLGTSVDSCMGLSGSNTIQLSAGRFRLAIAGQDEDQALTGDLDLRANITIRGVSADDTVIDANGIDRVLEVFTGADVRLVRLAVTGGGTSTWGTGSGVHNGGGIANAGTLWIASSRISGNFAESGAAGIFSTGTLTLRNSTVSRNRAFEGAGGIGSTGKAVVADSRVTANESIDGGFMPHRNDPGVAAGITSTGSLTLTRSVVDRNLGHGEWTHGGIAMLGGVISDSTIRRNATGMCGSGGVVMIWGFLRRSTVNGNTAGGCDGAGGVVAIDSQIWNSTITGNSTGTQYSPPSGSMQVGGVLSDVSTIVGSTITNNVNHAPAYGTSQAGGLLALALSPPAFAGNLAAIRDTILAGNRNAEGGRSDCAGRVTSDGHNLIGGVDGCTYVSRPNDLIGAAPRLGPLADNGGPTLTRMPLPGSPAIDLWEVTAPGSDASCPTRDQRGVVRPQDGDGDGVIGCDVGAIERNAP